MNLPCVKCSSLRPMEAPGSVISSGSLGIVNVMQHTYHTPRLDSKRAGPGSLLHTCCTPWSVCFLQIELVVKG